MVVPELRIDEPCVATFFIGEIGWFLQRYQAYLRYLKQEVYKDRKFFIVMNEAWHPFVQDFVDFTVDLPKEFKQLNLEQDCYEAPLTSSPAGSLTPPNVYAFMINYVRSFCTRENTIELFPPRGCNFIIDSSHQIFAKYTAEPLILDKPIICIFPRKRERCPDRNVPEFVWLDLVEKLKKDYKVVLCGVPNGACLANYDDPDVINLINKKINVDTTIGYLNSAICSISSQSGGTHISLLSGCSTYIIGHEEERHAYKENRLNIPASFRYVSDYRMIDADTIIGDITGFIDEIKQVEDVDIFDDVIAKDTDLLNSYNREVSNGR